MKKFLHPVRTFHTNYFLGAWGEGSWKLQKNPLGNKCMTPKHEIGN